MILRKRRGGKSPKVLGFQRSYLERPAFYLEYSEYLNVSDQPAGSMMTVRLENRTEPVGREVWVIFDPKNWHRRAKVTNSRLAEHVKGELPIYITTLKFITDAPGASSYNSIFGRP